MSSLPNVNWSARLFEKFTRLYGSQKVASMWADADPHAVQADWEAQIRRFPAQVIREAVQALIDKGTDWPPTLPAFVAICRDFHRPESQSVDQALPAPGQSYTDAATARANLTKIREMMSGAVKRMPA